MEDDMREFYKDLFEASDECPICNVRIEDGEEMVVRLKGLYHPTCYREVVKKELEERKRARD